VLTTLSHFRSEFEAHIREKRCSAGVCRGRTAPRPSMEIPAAMRP